MIYDSIYVIMCVYNATTFSDRTFYISKHQVIDKNLVSGVIVVAIVAVYQGLRRQTYWFAPYPSTFS